MMRVDDTFTIKGRGTLALVTLDHDDPEAGDVWVRESDGALWTVRGVERLGYRRNVAGMSVAILFKEPAVPRVGDVLRKQQ